ncbi:hypothetical protein T01_11675 [Trichinella spiralis]|uniref:Uncharacterized protein n=1 Tax=Trichinella spiralis TaxID=6334 RepID=A0A0V1BRB0_TRISP|nr:hypothetical protein T01_11675 [Trichinella spiralis]
MATVYFSLLSKKKCRVWSKSVQLFWNNGLLNLALCLRHYIVQFEDCATGNVNTIIEILKASFVFLSQHAAFHMEILLMLKSAYMLVVRRVDVELDEVLMLSSSCVLGVLLYPLDSRNTSGNFKSTD